MARVTGLEPAASGVTGRRSNQLSYTRADVACATSAVFTPPLPPCQPRMRHSWSEIAAVRMAGLREMMVGGEGIEPPTNGV